MRIVVFGATGRTGKPLVEQAIEEGHEVVAFVRDPTKLKMDHENLEKVEGNVRNYEDVETAIKDSDAVISVIGHTESSKDDVQFVGGKNMIDAMKEHGVSRFVTLTGAGVRHERDDISLGGKVMGSLLKFVAGEVLEDARNHVEYVKESGLDWTVVRVPRLTEGEYTGEYRTGYLSLGMRDTAARPDVAEFILHLATSDEYINEMPLVAN